jgi:hypothetical protein
MFNLKLYTTFNLLFTIIFLFQDNLQNKPLFLILDFQQMSSCEFEKVILVNGFEIENGILGLDRDCYLSVVNLLDSSILRKV